MTTAVLNQSPIEFDSPLISLALYGYACFTSFYVSKGKVKGLQYHMERLQNDCQSLFGQAPPAEDILANIHSFICNHSTSQTTENNFGVRVTIFPENFSIARPGDFASLAILVTGRSAQIPNSKAMVLHSIDAIRSLPMQKTVNMISNLKARAAAQQQGADDALMIDKGIITEGPTWNIFFGADNQLVTPSLDCGILPGVTRRLLIDAAKDAGIEVQETKLSLAELEQFQYCFITNAMIGVKPVESIDQMTFNTAHRALEIMQDQYSGIQSAPIRQ